MKASCLIHSERGEGGRPLETHRAAGVGREGRQGKEEGRDTKGKQVGKGEGRDENRDEQGG